MEKKLYRSTKNKALGGVCGGLGEYFNIDPVIIRIFLVLAFFPFFPFTIPFLPVIYIILWIILPADTAVIKENTETPPKDKKGAPSFVLSLILALFLIFLGFVILFPGYVFHLMDVLAFLIAFFLIFIAVRLTINMYADKEISLFQASAGFICLSYGVFIILNRLTLIGEGVFIEYSKNLVAGVLIVLGISLVFKNIKNKWPALIICSSIFLFVGVFSYLNGNYSPVSFMGRMMDRVMPRFRHFNWKNWRFRNESFSENIAAPDSVQSINCTIDNSLGNLKIEDSGDFIQYEGTGIPPIIQTNTVSGLFSFSFDNQASDTVLRINRGKLKDLIIQASAGNIEGNLKNMNIEKLKVIVNGGSVNIETGDKLKKMTVENYLGNTRISLPRNARIIIRMDSSLANITLPDEFKLKGHEYIYEGGPGSPVEISASVRLGNLEFNF